MKQNAPNLDQKTPSILVKNTGLVFITICLFGWSNPTLAQSNSINDYAVISGSPSCGSCVTDIGPNNAFSGGVVASWNNIISAGNLVMTADMYSAQSINLGGGNMLTGSVYAGGLNGTSFTTGSGFDLTGNLYLGGDANISSGTINGDVFRSGSSTYTGPTPTNDYTTGHSFNPLPSYPLITSIPASGSGKINANITLSPGQHGEIALKNGKTLTFGGPGDYVFSNIANQGSSNAFVFDFQGQTSGLIRILVHGDADLGKMDIVFAGGGDASRVLMEVHGDGSTNNGYAFSLSGGSIGAGDYSKWKGTLWAPYGDVSMGGGSNKAIVEGSIYSQGSIYFNNNVEFLHVPLDWCSVPSTVTFNNPGIVTCSNPTVTITASTTAPGPTDYSWSTADGSISAGNGTSSIDVTAGGTYSVSVTDHYGCIWTSSISVTENSCITPYYPPPTNGKADEKIGAELTSLFFNPTYVDDDTVVFVSDLITVYVDIIIVDNPGIPNDQETAALKSTLEGAPYNMISSSWVDNGPNSLIITGQIPRANLTLLNAVAEINYVRPAFPAISNKGVTTTQGDLVMKAPFVRGGFDVEGENITIGVISDSYDAKGLAATNVSGRDLPGTGNPDYPLPVNVLSDLPYGSDEGQAMLQIVHDVAPGAELAFHTGFISAGNMAHGIELLASSGPGGAGCDIIVDDITYITEPFLRDGVVSQAVDAAVANGVTYFSSAGNFGDKSYGSMFNAIPAPTSVLNNNPNAKAHNYSGDPSNPDFAQQISLTPGSYVIVLQWEDEFYSIGGSQSLGTQADLDIYLTDEQGNALFGFNRQNIGGDPIEVLPFDVSEATTSNLMVVYNNHTSASTPVEFKYVVFRGNVVFDEYANTGNSTIVGHANATGAITVGAVLYNNNPVGDAIFGTVENVTYNGSYPTPASFSSRGGTPVQGVVRQKPDLCAPNGVNNTILGTLFASEGDAFPNFIGTSAAAPHAAAVAALIASAQLKYEGTTSTPAELRNILTSNTLPMNAAGTNQHDNASGFGFIQADKALRTLAAPKPELYEVVGAGLYDGSYSTTVTLSGNYFTESTEVYLRDDQLTVTFINDSTLEVAIDPFFGNPPILVENDAQSTSGIDGGSALINFYDLPKKQVRVKAFDQAKRYGELVAPLTYSVSVEDVNGNLVELSAAGMTLDDVGLTGFLDVSTNVTTFSDASSIPYPIFVDTVGEVPVGYTELYDYEFVNAQYMVNRLPLTISANDLTVEYGDEIDGFTYSYSFPTTAVDPTALTVLQTSVSTEHTEALTNALAIVSGRALVNGVDPLDAADLNRLSFLATANALASGRALVNRNGLALVNRDGRALVNGTTKGYALVNDLGGNIDDLSWAEFNDPYDDVTGTLEYTNDISTPTTEVVDLAFESIEHYLDPNSYLSSGNYSTTVTAVNNAIQSTSGRALVNGTTTSSGRALVNALDAISGRALVNGYNLRDAYPLVNNFTNSIDGSSLLTPDFYTPIANGTSSSSGRALVNGYPLVNGVPVQTANNEIVMIVNAEDAQQTGESGLELYPIILITGYEVGQHFIVPPAYNNSNFDISYVLGTLTVTPAQLTVQALDATVEYGQAVDASVLDYVVYGFEYVDTPAVEITNLANVPMVLWSNGSTVDLYQINAGTYTIAPAGVQLKTGSNYTWTGVTATLTVTKKELLVSPDDQSKSYGASLPALTVSYNGWVYNDQAGDLDSPPSLSTAVNSQTSVGDYDIIAVGGLDNNYFFTFDVGVFTVDPAPLTVTADDATTVYGSGIPNLSVSYSGFVLGETEAVLNSTPTATTAATSSSGVLGAPYAIVASGGSAQNYYFIYINGALMVTPAPLTVSADNAITVYGTSATNLTVTYSGFVLGQDESVLTTQPTVNANATLTSGVLGSPYSIVASGASADNYSMTYVDGALNITPAPLTVTADNASQVYGTSASNLTVSYSGFVLNEDESVLASLPSASSTATSSSGVLGSPYPIVVSGGSADNYTISYVDGALNVTPAPLTITADNAQMVYGGSLPNLTVSYSGFVLGDNENTFTSQPVVSTTATQSSGAGTYDIVVSGGSADNYDVIGYNNGTLFIAPASLEIIADNDFIFEGDPAPTTFTYTVSGTLFNGDAITVDPTFGVSGYTSNAQAGAYDIAKISDAVVSGGVNYSITYTPGTLYVNPYGPGTKKVQPSLVCVDTLINHPSGMPYVAYMEYENKNQADVYVPIGSDNEIVTTGSYIGTQPELFLSGTHSFQLFFDGTKITWTLRTYLANQKASAASDASSSSNKCNANGKADEIVEDFIVYPNPTSGILNLKFPSQIEGACTIVVTNALGQVVHMVEGVQGNVQELRLDLSGQVSGSYYIQIVGNDVNKSFIIIKQ